MRVRDVMTTRVLTVEPDDSIGYARDVMRDAGVHQLVVRDGGGRVVGVIAAADAAAAPERAAVGDFMCRRLVAVGPDTPVAEAATLMRLRAIGSLPVLDDSRLVGIVTVSDMLGVVARALAIERSDSSAVEHRSPVRPGQRSGSIPSREPRTPRIRR